MKSPLFLYIVTMVLTGIYSTASGNDSLATEIPDSVQSPAHVAVTDSITVPDTLVSFSVLQKKYLKTSIITNVLFAGGFGIYYGLVLPRMGKAENNMDAFKLMPLMYLSVGMMYASLPIAVVSSHRAKKNYEYSYKTAPKNISIPLTLAGAGLHIGAVGSSLWQMIADYRDNKEIDGSYNKYEDLTMGLYTAGLITLAGTNLYALVYTVILGEKAKQSSSTATATATLQLTPIRYGDANGCLLTWNF